MVRGTDWGSYIAWNNTTPLPWKDLIEKGGIRFFITKGAEDYPDQYYSTSICVKEARDSGIPIVATYYWLHPEADQTSYLNLYKKDIDKQNPDFIAIDMEENGKDENGHPISAQQISDNGHILADGLRIAYPEKQIILYTRYDYISNISPALKTWVKDFDGGWIAGWPDYGLPTYYVDWAYLNNWQMRQNMYPGVKEINVANSVPELLPTWTTWKFWQYSSRIRINPALLSSPLYDHQYDWNMFNGSLEDLKAWIKKEIVIPPVTSPLTLDSLDARLKIVEEEQARIKALPYYRQLLPIIKK